MEGGDPEGEPGVASGVTGAVSTLRVVVTKGGSEADAMAMTEEAMRAVLGVGETTASEFTIDVFHKFSHVST